VSIRSFISDEPFGLTSTTMNMLTNADLNAAGAPLLRTGAGDEDEEEFLLATFGDVEIHISASDEAADAENESMTEELPLNRTRGALYVTTKYGDTPLHGCFGSIYTDSVCCVCM
jgi:hypothetical protein